MRINLLHSVPALAFFAFFSLGSTMPYQWESEFPYPIDAETKGGVAFHAAVELKNGDFVVSGSGWYKYLIRMDPHGVKRWIASIEHIESGIQPMEVAGLYASGNGLVVLRHYWDYGTNNDAGDYLERYDDAGTVTSKIRVADSKWEFSGDGGVFSTTSPAPADTFVQPALSLQKRMFDGSPGWSTALGGFHGHEVLGIIDRGHSDPVVLCAPLSKGLMDTVFAFGLDATGKMEWRTKFETGRNMDPITGHPRIRWSTSARMMDGRIAAAGVQEAIKGTSPGSDVDSLMVLVWDPNDGKAYMFGKAVYPTDLEHEGGVGVSNLRPSGPRSLLMRAQSTVGSETAYREMEIRVDGVTGGVVDGTWLAPPKGRVDCCGHPIIFLPKYAFLDFGHSIDSIGPVPPYDAIPYPTSINTAALFVGPADGSGVWKTLGLEEFKDTVWTRNVPLPRGGIITTMSGFRTLNFLIPTSDGGALVGGNLWRNNPQDTITIAAIKLGPGYSVGLMPMRKDRQASGARISGGFSEKGVHLFDAMGRRQGRVVPAGFPLGGRYRN